MLGWGQRQEAAWKKNLIRASTHTIASKVKTHDHFLEIM